MTKTNHVCSIRAPKFKFAFKAIVSFLKFPRLHNQLVSKSKFARNGLFTMPSQTVSASGETSVIKRSGLDCHQFFSRIRKHHLAASIRNDVRKSEGECPSQGVAGETASPTRAGITKSNLIKNLPNHEISSQNMMHNSPI